MKQLSDLKKKRLFLFDIDGTIAIDSYLLDGTKELLQYIESVDGKAIYITNNSTKSISDYISKFKKWNIQTDVTNFITSSYATAVYLKEKYPKDLIYVLGTKSFVRELRDFGLNVTENAEKNVKCVVVGFDNELNYDKITDVCMLLETKKTDYLATNIDEACPTSFGFVPDCGAICKMIACATKRVPTYIGKPNPRIVDMCLEQTGFQKQETIVVGDRLYTDIACGINAQVDTAVVFTGEACREDMKETSYQATWCFDTIRDLYECIKASKGAI